MAASLCTATLGSGRKITVITVLTKLAAGDPDRGHSASLLSLSDMKAMFYGVVDVSIINKLCTSKIGMNVHKTFMNR